MSKRNLATPEQAALGQKLGRRSRSLKMGERGLGTRVAPKLALICSDFGPAIPTGRTPSNSGIQTFLGYCEGVVCKQGHRALQRSRQLWRVLRRRGGVDHRVLESRVQEAMNSDPPPYHPTSSNCVHFALNLLGVDSVSVSLLPAHIPSQLKSSWSKTPNQFAPE